MYEVYAHYRKTDGHLFHIGHGTPNRKWCTDRSQHWNRVYKKHGRDIEVLYQTTDKHDAAFVESTLIKWYQAENWPYLTNKKDGIELGFWKYRHSIISKKKMSIAKKGKTRMPLSKTTKEKISVANTGKTKKFSPSAYDSRRGRTANPEHIQKRVAAMKKNGYTFGRRKVVDSFGEVFESTTLAAKRHNISRFSVAQILAGRSKQTKAGVSFAYYEE